MADTQPPVVISHDPAPNTSGHSPNTSIYLRVVDTSAGVDLNSLRVFVNGDLAVSGNIFLPDFDGPVSVISPEGMNFSIMIDPTELFALGQQVVVGVQAADLVANLLTTTSSEYSFFISEDPIDVVPPFVEFRSPEIGTSQNTTDTEIVLRLNDDVGVDLFTVVIRVNGEDAYKNGASQPGYTVTVSASGLGYQFSIRKQIVLTPGTIVVAVSAADTIGNLLETFWSFSVQAPSSRSAVIPQAPKKPRLPEGRYGVPGSVRSRGRGNSQRRNIDED